jgi:glycine cleavage system H lipoate-binding protein
MFPGVDGFHWTIGHVLFISLFFIVALTIATTVVAAVWRTVRDFRAHRAIEFCWKSEFAELPERERRCRHELAGRVTSRVCDNGFDCRQCDKYAQLAVLPERGIVHDLGVGYSNDRFYHRGHTWVKREEEDGTLAIGLDELAERLIGSPDSIQMPELGSEIEVNGSAWRMKKNGNEIRVRAPIDGTVVAVGGPKEGWYLKVRPRRDANDPATLRHLLRGAEVHGWLARELERLQVQLRPPNTAPSLADGGALVNDLMDAVPEADWGTVLADTFLEA